MRYRLLPLLLTAACTSETPAVATGPTDRDARYRCQDFVEQRLVSPSTATHSDSANTKVFNTGGGTFSVRGYVDSQNQMGGTVRAEYMCFLRHVGGDNWEADSVLLKPRV